MPFPLVLSGMVLAATLARTTDLPPILEPKFFPVFQAFDVCFPFVLFDPGSREYRLYYTATGADALSDATRGRWSTGLVVSSDLKAWQPPQDYLPVLRPYDFREGQLVAPVAARDFDALGAFGVHVLRDGPVYRMWYTGWAGQEAEHDGRWQPVGFRIGLAESADGRLWRKLAGGAGLGSVLAPDVAGSDRLGAAQPAVLRDGAGYRMWYEGYDGRAWRILTAVSADGMLWRKQGVVLETGEPGAPDAGGARNPVVVRRGDAYELWYQGVSADGEAFSVLRAASVDGLRWARSSEPVTLHPQPPLAPGEQIHVDSMILQADGSRLVFFAKQTPGPAGEKFDQVRRLSFRIYAERLEP